jgi:hypothetical protein
MSELDAIKAQLIALNIGMIALASACTDKQAALAYFDLTCQNVLPSVLQTATDSFGESVQEHLTRIRLQLSVQA